MGMLGRERERGVHRSAHFLHIYIYAFAKATNGQTDKLLLHVLENGKNL